MRIHWHNTHWLDREGRERVEALLFDLAEQGAHDLIDVRITGRPSRHKGHSMHEVHITCDARGKEIVVVETGKKMDKVLHDALGTFKQRVRKMREMRVS